jgi:isopentenyl-diphosphate delta-isomerase
MKIHPATSASSTDQGPLVEVMDQHNRVLAAMPVAEVRRQQLCHRSIVVLLYDEAGRLFLRKRPGLGGQGPERWDTPVRSPVFRGEALQDAATRTLEATLGIHAERMRLVQAIAPSLENGNEFQHVFSLARSEDSASQGQLDEADNYFFGPEELRCLLRDFSELVSARFILLAKELKLPRRESRPA